MGNSDDRDPGDLFPIAMGAAFDPGRVYFTAQIGQLDLAHDARRHTAVFDAADLSLSSAAFDTISYVGGIRPTDGALLYMGSTATNELYMRQYIPDGSFIEDPRASDPEIELPTCLDGKPLGFGFNIAPDTGDVLFQCSTCNLNGCQMQYLSGTSFNWTEKHSFAAIGYGGRYLFHNVMPTYILNPDGARTPIGEGPQTIEAVRATPNGFWILEEAIVTHELTRWHIDYDGSITEKVEYPPSPVPLNVYYMRHAFDSLGRAYTLIQEEWGPEVPRSIIVRFDPTAEFGEIILDTDTVPQIDFNTRWNAFFTGP